MATKTLADMAALVLEGLGVKPAGQNATAEDTTAAEEAVTSAYQRLRYVGKAPYAIASVPEWAWTPLRDVAARDLVNTFGLGGERLQSVLAAAARADLEIAKQTSAPHDPRVVAAVRYY